MNIRLICYIIGQITRAEGLLMLIPLIAALCYGETPWPLAIPIVILLALGFALTWRRPAERDRMGVRDGLFVVGLS